MEDRFRSRLHDMEVDYEARKQTMQAPKFSKNGSVISSSSGGGSRRAPSHQAREDEPRKRKVDTREQEVEESIEHEGRLGGHVDQRFPLAPVSLPPSPTTQRGVLAELDDDLQPSSNNATAGSFHDLYCDRRQQVLRHDGPQQVQTNSYSSAGPDQRDFLAAAGNGGVGGAIPAITGPGPSKSRKVYFAVDSPPSVDSDSHAGAPSFLISLSSSRSDEQSSPHHQTALAFNALQLHLLPSRYDVNGESSQPLTPKNRDRTFPATCL